MRCAAALCWVALLNAGALAVEPAKPAAFAAAYRAADAAWQSGDLALARTLTADLSAHLPGDPALWLRLGQIEHARGDFLAALNAYDNALASEAANSVDGGGMAATIRVHRARLLVDEAAHDVDASGGAPLAQPLEKSRTALRRSIELARAAGALEPLEKTPKAPRSAGPARGYVIDASQPGRRKSPERQGSRP